MDTGFLLFFREGLAATEIAQEIFISARGHDCSFQSAKIRHQSELHTL